MTSSPHQRIRAWLVSLAMMSFVLVQSLGAMHGVMHTPRGVLGKAASLSAPAAGLSNLGGLFAGHDRDKDCQLYDQLSHADLASLAVAATPFVFLPDTGASRAPTLPLVARAVAFRARDPPVLA